MIGLLFLGFIFGVMVWVLVRGEMECKEAEEQLAELQKFLDGNKKE